VGVRADVPAFRAQHEQEQRVSLVKKAPAEAEALGGPIGGRLGRGSARDQL
jgi:hypothetical protein